MQSLYGQNGHDLSKEDLLALQSQGLGIWIELAIETLRKADLLMASYLESSIKRTGPGLKAFLSDTYHALALGRDFVVRASRPAIVHVVVHGKKKKETGGTGFYCADVGGRLVTAAHNVLDREILRIESGDGKLLHSPPIGVYSLIKDLDLAILDVVTAEASSCLKVEWDKEEILPLMPLYVMGFPQVPQQAVAPITYKSTELAATGLDYNRRETYLIKSATSPGFSGGPAISPRGRVVGIVQGIPDDPESTTTTADTKEGGSTSDTEEIQIYDTEYSVLTPAFFLEELEPTLREKKLIIMTGGVLL